MQRTHVWVANSFINLLCRHISLSDTRQSLRGLSEQRSDIQSLINSANILSMSLKYGPPEISASILASVREFHRSESWAVFTQCNDPHFWNALFLIHLHSFFEIKFLLQKSTALKQQTLVNVAWHGGRTKSQIVTVSFVVRLKALKKKKKRL